MIAKTAVAEIVRRIRLVSLNTQASERVVLEQRYGQVWNPLELKCDFDALGYLAPVVVVRRKSDGALGSLEFQHHPRFYFNWKED